MFWTGSRIPITQVICWRQKRGWFKEADLDVEIFGEVHGEMELHGADFVCGPEIAMLECRERGINLTGIAVMTQKCDSGIVSLKEAGCRPSQRAGGQASDPLDPSLVPRSDSSRGRSRRRRLR